MKEQDICKHLDLKFEEFLLNFEDLELRSLLQKKMYFAGGCIYCLKNDNAVKDYDLFLIDDSLIEKIKNVNIWSFMSDYALTRGKYQVVIKYFGEPNFCVGQFDFKHNMHYYLPKSNKISCAYVDELYLEEPEFDDFKYLQTNELYFNENRARDIEGVWLRIEKFTKRGMTISKETKKKIKKRITKKTVRSYKKSRSSGRKSYY